MECMNRYSKTELIKIHEDHITRLIMDIRYDKLIINNPVLSQQFNEEYIVMLRHGIIQKFDKIKELKFSINRLAGKEIYSEDEVKRD